MYDYRRHARFDIGLNGLGLPVETVLMYGFWVVRAHWHPLLLVSGVSLSWGAATPASRRWAIHAVLVLLTSVDVLRLSAHRDILWRSQASGSSVAQSCMRSAGIDSKCRKFRVTRIAWRLKAMAAILVS